MRHHRTMGKWGIAACLAVTLALGVGAAWLGFWALVPALVAATGFAASGAWKRWDFETRSVTPNLMLVALPTVIAGPAIVGQPATMGVLALMALTALWRPARVDLSAACVLLPVIGLAIVGRPNYPGDKRSMLFFALASVTVTLCVRLSASKASAITSLVDGVGLFLVVSLVLQYAGLGHRAAVPVYEQGNSLTGGSRVVFPLDYSQATTPLMAAVFLAAVLPILLTVQEHRWLRWVAVAASFNVLIFGDRRSALLTAVLLGACLLLIPKVFRRTAPWIAGAALLTPFVYPHIRSTVGNIMDAAGSVTPFLTRRGEGDTAALNMRDRIWDISLTHWAHLDWKHQMLGYGNLGQAKSGMALKLRPLFGGNYRNPTTLTPHNSVLQLLFDGGWIVTAAFAVAIIFMARALRRDLAGLAMLTALIIVSITEVALSPSHAWGTWWMLVILGVIAFARERETEQALVPGDAEIGEEQTAKGRRRCQSSDIRGLPVNVAAAPMTARARQRL
jgi:hypothetical protein